MEERAERAMKKEDLNMILTRPWCLCVLESEFRKGKVVALHEKKNTMRHLFTCFARPIKIFY